MNIKTVLVGPEKSGVTNTANAVYQIESENNNSKIEKMSKDMAKQTDLIANSHEPITTTTESDENFQLTKNGQNFDISTKSPRSLEIEDRAFDKQKTKDLLNLYDIKILCANIFTFNDELSKNSILNLISTVQNTLNAQFYQTFKNIVNITFHFDIDLLNHPIIEEFKGNDDLILANKPNDNGKQYFFIDKNSSAAIDSERNKEYLDSISDVIKIIMRQKSYNLSPFKSVGDICQIVILTHTDLVYNLGMYRDQIDMCLNSSNRDIIYTPAFKTGIKDPNTLVDGESHFYIVDYSKEFNENLFKCMNKYQKKKLEPIRNNKESSKLSLATIPINTTQVPQTKPVEKKSKFRWKKLFSVIPIFPTRIPQTPSDKKQTGFRWKTLLLIFCLIILTIYAGFWTYIRFQEYERNQVSLNQLHEKLKQTFNQADMGKQISTFIAQQIEPEKIYSKIKSNEIASLIASKVVVPEITKHDVVQEIAKENDLKIDKTYFTKLLSERLLALNLENVYFVKNSEAYLRSQPNNLKRDRITKLVPYEIVISNKQSGSFYHVKTTDNKRGWVHASSIIKLKNLHLLLTL